MFTNRNNTALILFRLFLLLINSALLIACGSGGDDGPLSESEDQDVTAQSLDDETDGGDSSDQTRTMYAALRAVNSNSESSSFSNETSVNVGDDASISINFTEPVLQMDGACLSSPIEKYIVHCGDASGNYTETIEVTRDSRDLNCVAVGSHASCGDITNCSVDVSV